MPGSAIAHAVCSAKAAQSGAVSRWVKGTAKLRAASCQRSKARSPQIRSPLVSAQSGSMKSWIRSSLQRSGWSSRPRSRETARASRHADPEQGGEVGGLDRRPARQHPGEPVMGDRLRSSHGNRFGEGAGQGRWRSGRCGTEQILEKTLLAETNLHQHLAMANGDA